MASRGALFQRHFPGIKPPDTVARGNFEGVLTGFRRRFAGHASDPAYRDKMEGVLRRRALPRLRRHPAAARKPAA